ncbi:MAG TPA: glutamyl-tRNA reductase [Gaiellaceae bacterium]|nr:glutamyl-tRNA reductase [Gaiellaceae bacterium]
MRLVLVGTSHHRAPVELRERVALDREAAAEAAAQLAGGGAEAVVLSTCNRTEAYVAHADPAAAETVAASLFSDPELHPALYRLRDEAAALHLFRVASGLDSLVPGEGEILGQVRSAYESGAPGRVLDRLFRQALHTGKKVRTHTAIAESPASVSGAAAALAQSVFGDLTGRRILLVGAGKVSELAARNLLTRGAEIAFVANRSPDHAAELAARIGAEPLPLERIREELVRTDVVVASTSAPGLVLRAEDVPPRKGRPLLLVDLAVPRDLDPAIHQLDGCFLYDIDDLEAVVAESLLARRGEADRAERLVALEAERWRDWQASLDVVPAIASLRARAEEIRRAELERVAARLTDEERRALESVTARMLDKLLHLPTVRMKQAAVTADGVLYADAVRHLFGLGEEQR